MKMFLLKLIKTRYEYSRLIIYVRWHYILVTVLSLFMLNTPTSRDLENERELNETY